VMKLLLIALNLETDRTDDYAEQLAVNLPLASQFLLCRTIHIEDREGHGGGDDDDEGGNQEAYRIMPNEDGSFIIKPTSPGRAQATAAALMHVLRVTFAAAMVHASKTNNPRWKKVLWHPSVFSFSRPIQDLGYRSKIARGHSKNVFTGTARASVIMNLRQGLFGWKISQKGHADLTLPKSSFISGVRKLCRDGDKCVRQMLQELTKMAYYSFPGCYWCHTKYVPGSRRTCKKSHPGPKTVRNSLVNRTRAHHW
jgi:hypothetical protein